MSNNNTFEFKENYERLPRGGPLKPILYLVSEKGCHEVISHSKDQDGYTRVCRRVGGKKKMVYLHRKVYEQCVGEILEGHVVRHSCDNPSCINPKHLSIGTVQDNTDDRTSKGRQARGATNGNTKLTSEQVLLIREDERLAKFVAKDFGISTTHVYYIRNKDSWKHL